jgi:carbon-monoxide dehydrogenase iron sulfur subunit
MRKVIHVAIEKCVGCKSCELACAVAHSRSKDLWLAVAERPLPQQRVRVNVVEEFAVPLHCRHCQDAPCIQVCPTHAMSRSGPDEPVLCKAARCIGCTLCMLVCPFGVLQMSREGTVVVKCDLCFELAQQGQDPACVTACPTKAIRLIDVEELSEEIARRAREDWVAGHKAGEQVKIPVRKE